MVDTVGMYIEYTQEELDQLGAEGLLKVLSYYLRMPGLKVEVTTIDESDDDIGLIGIRITKSELPDGDQYDLDEEEPSESDREMLSESDSISEDLV